jgi:hypothetical protein
LKDSTFDSLSTSPGGCRCCNAQIFSFVFTPTSRRMVGRWPSLGSSALRSFRVSTALFTTTASADSSADLSAEISPGKVHEHFGLRAVRLYLMRLSVTLGFRVVSHAYRPHPASLPVRVPTVVVLATAFFRAEFLAEPALAFTTVAVTASGHFFLFHFFSDLFMPMLGTRRSASSPDPFSNHGSAESLSDTIHAKTTRSARCADAEIHDFASPETPLRG